MGALVSLSDAADDRRRARGDARANGSAGARLNGMHATDAAQDLSIEGLLRDVALGDRAAFAELYDRTSARVMGLVTRLLRDRAQSEEVTQEVYLEIWQQAPKFDANRGSGMAWVLTMTHRRAVDRIRASQKSHERDLRIGIRDMERDFDGVAEAVEIRVENERVKRAMSRLTPLQREAVILAYYGGYSHSEMAEILAIPLGTVKTRLRDGMIRLRDELGVTS
jgi:RNA polymerase sigma-70 factor (ECF subfamily)